MLASQPRGGFGRAVMICACPAGESELVALGFVSGHDMDGPQATLATKAGACRNVGLRS